MLLAAEVLDLRLVDIYLNDAACWRNIPRRVWEYTLGGYQVLKKWLSYGERSILGRPLTVDEVAYVRDVAGALRRCYCSGRRWMRTMRR